MAPQEPALRLLNGGLLKQLGGRLEVLFTIGVHLEVRYRAHAAACRFAPNRTKSLSLKPLDLSGVSSALTLEVEVLANRVVKQTHGDKAY
jgi:hypothetical protein